MLKYCLSTEVVAVERGVEVGELLQRRDRRLDQEREHRELDARLLVLLVERDAQRLEVGDVRLVELRDVRDHHPVAREVRAGELLDARQRLRLDRAELREVDLRPRDQVELAAAARPRGRSRRARHDLLDERAHVLDLDAAFRPRAGHLRHVDAELARDQSHRRRGVRDLEGLLVDRCRLGLGRTSG
jgi:hypothetical protein